VVVEDAVHGVEAAKAAGMRCVAVAQTFPAGKLGGADLIRPAVRDLSISDLLGEIRVTLPPPVPTARPWGFWASLGLGFLAAGAWMLAQGMIAVLGIFVGAFSREARVDSELLGSNGLLLSIATLVGAPVAAGMSWLFAAIRKGAVPKQYLALKSFSGRELLKWGLCLVALMMGSDLISLSLGKPLVPDVMVEMYNTTAFKPLFWLAIIVAAPLAEETLFRGFMFRGMAESRLGVPGTVVLTSLLWAMLHLQYDWYGIVSVFVIGLFLGWVRHRTGSLYAPILLHGFGNLVATVEAAMLAA
jgi:membrane protease YdiL (CAAX protease family)